MFKNINIRTNLKFGAIAALLFGIPVYAYILDNTYTKSWLIYLGSALFCGVITVYTLFYNKTKDGNANTVQMIFTSLVTVVIGVVLSCLLCFVMLAIMVPGYLGTGAPGNISSDAPVNTVHDKTNGLSFRVFVGALLINFFFGAFAGSLLSFSAKRDQTRNSGNPGQVHKEGAA
jgi:hypothetical protein